MTLKNIWQDWNNFFNYAHALSAPLLCHSTILNSNQSEPISYTAEYLQKAMNAIFKHLSRSQPFIVKMKFNRAIQEVIENKVSSTIK